MTFFSHCSSATSQRVNGAVLGCALTQCSGQIALNANRWDATQQWAACEHQHWSRVARFITLTSSDWLSHRGRFSSYWLTQQAECWVEFPPETHMILKRWEIRVGLNGEIHGMITKLSNIKCHTVTVNKKKRILWMLKLFFLLYLFIPYILTLTSIWTNIKKFVWSYWRSMTLLDLCISSRPTFLKYYTYYTCRRKFIITQY